MSDIALNQFLKERFDKNSIYNHNSERFPFNCPVRPIISGSVGFLKLQNIGNLHCKRTVIKTILSKKLIFLLVNLYIRAANRKGL